MPPSFLPSLLKFDGSWSELEEEAYRQFRDAFIVARIRFLGRVIMIDTRVDSDGKENGFWHVVERKDKVTGVRYPVIEIAQRIPWIIALVGNPQDPSVTSFRYLEGSGRVRHYLWMQPEDFVVILEEKGSAYVLITAFMITETWMRRNLQKKYNKRIT